MTVCKDDAKVIVIDYYYGHYCTRVLFTFLMRTKRTFSPKCSYYLTRWKYEPWIQWAYVIILHKMAIKTQES